jgi:starch phosphorylase
MDEPGPAPITEDCAPDEEIWEIRGACRRALVEYVRRRLERQEKRRSAPAELVSRAARILDPNALTLGFARRFATYKRPGLLLHDPDRLRRILCRADHPVQLIVAGKAHPEDMEAKRIVQTIASFAEREDVFDRVVYLEDYDMALTQQLAGGVDVWLNTPRRPLEACGTSGMKMLVNGGLNLSVLDGWWAEAYRPGVGWQLGDGLDDDGPDRDKQIAEQLYRLLENEIVPEFYDRDDQGIPRRWIARLRESMCDLTLQFSSHRMMRDYVERGYLPAADTVRARTADSGKLGIEVRRWADAIAAHWKTVRFGEQRCTEVGGERHISVQVYFGDLDADYARVELYADPFGEGPAEVIPLDSARPIPGASNGQFYEGALPGRRPVEHYTARVVPHHPAAGVPLEENHILWRQKSSAM